MDCAHLPLRAFFLKVLGGKVLDQSGYLRDLREDKSEEAEGRLAQKNVPGRKDRSPPPCLSCGAVLKVLAGERLIQQVFLS